MIKSKVFLDTRTGKRVSQFSVLDIKFMEELKCFGCGCIVDYDDFLLDDMVVCEDCFNKVKYEASLE